MKLLLTFIFMFISLNTNAQFFKKLFQHSTIYTSGNITMPREEIKKEFFVTQEGELRDITNELEFNYIYSIGWRKLARFDYENKQNQFYDGSERPIALSSGVGNVDNWEWLFNYDWVRDRGNEYNNQRYFLRYLGPWYIIKGELREEGAINFNYTAGDIRGRLKIGEKFNLSLGGIYRISDKVFGLNPIEEYLKPDTAQWWDLAYDYEYKDHYYSINNDDHDWYWTNADGERVADTDLDFRKHIFKNLVNDYNTQIFESIDKMGYLSMIVGYDFYHYSNNFWLHNYVSVMPLHKQISGDEEFGYGKFYAMEDNEKKHWLDYQAGLVLGLKIKKAFGFFLEGEYSRLWDKDIYNAKVGFNITFK